MMPQTSVAPGTPTLTKMNNNNDSNSKYKPGERKGRGQEVETLQRTKLPSQLMTGHHLARLKCSLKSAADQSVGCQTLYRQFHSDLYRHHYFRDRPQTSFPVCRVHLRKRSA